MEMRFTMMMKRMNKRSEGLLPRRNIRRAVLFPFFLTGILLL